MAEAGVGAGFEVYQRQFARHLRDPGATPPPAGVSPERMRIYAELVFNARQATLATCYPVCKKVLGQRRWLGLVRQFIAEHRAASPLFRQIPEEFLQFLHGRAEMLPPYIESLAHYEWIELALSVADVDDGALPQGDLLTEVPVLTSALALLYYPYPVHRISPRCKPQQPDPVHLLVFRNAAGQVRFVELNPASARLLDLLQTGELTGQQALQQVVDALPEASRDAALQHGRAFLAELQRLGAIAGVIAAAA